MKILAIDDNQDNLISLMALVKDIFPDALRFTALNGAEGLELAAATNPDVILLDIVMPDMDGFEVCKKLKAEKVLSDIPVVFVTAFNRDKERRIRALEAGAEAFLTKPIEESELTAQIRAMVKIKNANVEKQNEKERLATLVEEQTRGLRETHAATLNLLEGLKDENESRKKSEEALERLACIDDLTNVYNRRMFMKIAAQEMHRFRRYETPITFIMIDMDNLKAINDLYGHSAGDRALKGFTQAIFARIRQVDILARLGGDEFCVLLVNTMLADGRIAAIHIQEEVRNTKIELLSGKVLKVTASMGLSEATKEDVSLDSVVSRADAALYEAKRLGRDRIR